MNEDQARSRFFVIGMLRLVGVFMVLAGILMLRGIVPGDWAGYVLIAVGLVDTFVVPQILARKWRTPPGSNAGIE